MSEQSLIQYLLKGGIWALAGKLFTALMSFLLTAILARVLAPDNMALFFLANSVALFLALSARFGLDNTLLRLVSESLAVDNHKRAKAILKKGIILVGVLSSFLGLFFYFGPGSWLLSLIFPSQNLSNFLGFIIVWSVALSFQFLFGEIFRALKIISLSVLFGGALSMLFSVGLLLFLWKTESIIIIETVLIIVLIAGLLNFIFGFSILIFRLRNYGVADSSIHYSELLHSSWPLWFNSIFHFTLGFSGLWILGAFGKVIDVAYFGSANRLTLLIGMSLMMVNSVVPPLIARLKVKNKSEELERLLRGTATIAAIPSVIIILLLFVFSEEAMSLVFSKSYASGADILQILLISQLIGVLSGSCGYLLMMTGHQKIIMIINMIAAFISVLLGVLFVEQYGGIGIAWVTMVTIVIQQIVTVIYAYKMSGVWSHFSIHYLKLFIQKDIMRGSSRA